jgi:hypothetical protein
LIIQFLASASVGKSLTCNSGLSGNVAKAEIPDRQLRAETGFRCKI